VLSDIGTGNQRVSSANIPRSPPFTPLPPPLRGDAGGRRDPEHHVPELACPALPVTGRAGRPHQRHPGGDRRPAGLRRGTRQALGKRRSPLAITALPARDEGTDRTRPSPARLHPARANGHRDTSQQPHRSRRRVPQRSRTIRHAGPGPHGHRLRPRPGHARHAPRGRRPALPRLSDRLGRRAESPQQATAELHRPAPERAPHPGPAPRAGSPSPKAATETWWPTPRPGSSTRA
jgi:hypothetical protein